MDSYSNQGSHMLRHVCALQKLRAAAKEVDEQQSQIFRLEVRLAEANKKLDHTADLEKELLHYRYPWRLLLFCTLLKRSQQFTAYLTHPAQNSYSIQHLSFMRLAMRLFMGITLLRLGASCRKLAKDAEKKGQGGLWGYISGS